MLRQLIDRVPSLPSGSQALRLVLDQVTKLLFVQPSISNIDLALLKFKGISSNEDELILKNNIEIQIEELSMLREMALKVSKFKKPLSQQDKGSFKYSLVDHKKLLEYQKSDIQRPQDIGMIDFNLAGKASMIAKEVPQQNQAPTINLTNPKLANRQMRYLAE